MNGLQGLNRPADGTSRFRSMHGAKWRLGRDDVSEKHRHPGFEEGRPDRLLLPLYPNMKATLQTHGT
jgi:hypothetical protein